MPQNERELAALLPYLFTREYTVSNRTLSAAIDVLRHYTAEQLTAMTKEKPEACMPFLCNQLAQGKRIEAYSLAGP